MGAINCKRNMNSSGASEIEEKRHSEGDFVDAVVCKEDDIKDDEMKTFDIENAGKILLVKQNGIYSALGTKCSHYGALLNTGVLGQNRIRCPWHGACFNLATGDIEDFPGLDSIPCYKVQIDQGFVKVRAKRQDIELNKRLKDMCERDLTNQQTFVIIGGGPSGGICVETLRQEGFTGRIVLICKENTFPYDRIKLSKSMDIELMKLNFRDNEFYAKYSIETLLGVEAIKVESQNSTVLCSNGFVIKYDKLYVATGSRAKKAPIPGADLKNVVTLRTHEDAKYINDILHSEMVVVCLGSSFISLEAAAYCIGKVKKVIVIGRGAAPLTASLGTEIGERILKMYVENGVEMFMNNGIKKCIGIDGVLSAVELSNGLVVPCQLCIMGTGSEYYTKFLNGSGINVNEHGSIDVDKCLRSNIHNIYVGGDIANAPILPLSNERATIGHYQLAQYHGKIAGMNMAGNYTELRAVPFFWTMLFGKSFRYTGYGKPHETQIEGSLEDLKFVAFYMDKNGYVIGMASCMRDPVVAQFAEFQSQGKLLHKNDLIEDPFSWTKLINS